MTMSKTFQLALAPQKLWQAINPWTFYQQGAQLGFINIDLGQTPHPEIEQAILDDVGSYGRQLGRIGLGISRRLRAHGAPLQVDAVMQLARDVTRQQPALARGDGCRRDHPAFAVGLRVWTERLSLTGTTRARR